MRQSRLIPTCSLITLLLSGNCTPRQSPPTLEIRTEQTKTRPQDEEEGYNAIGIREIEYIYRVSDNPENIIRGIHMDIDLARFWLSEEKIRPTAWHITMAYYRTRFLNQMDPASANLIFHEINQTMDALLKRNYARADSSLERSSAYLTSIR